MSSAADMRRRCNEVLQRIQQASLSCGRDIDEITIVAVAKKHSLEEVEEMVRLGFSEIAESRVQETEKKYATGRPDCRLHLVGHLQTNKVKKAVGLFDVIQSVDSIRLATKISKQAAESNKRIPILLEVNTSGEEQKYGLVPEKTAETADKIAVMENLVLSGLMTVGPLTDDESRIRSSFRRLRKLLETIKSDHPELAEFRTLSMGMSTDFELAIQEGATMLRIGTALFGPRRA
jgi:hypothetical protein